MKIISFSLWGNLPRYTYGAIKNAELAKIMYPDFKCWFYVHKESVSIEIIKKLENLDNVKIIYKEGNINKIKPMMWRFESIDDPDVTLNLSRDTDTRILLREKLAVEEWINSDNNFHIMRDHPWHNELIQGGMFGVKKTNINWKNLIDKVVQNGNRNYDQKFLKDHIYPLYKNDCMIHASFHKIEGEKCKDFPLKLEDDDYKFVGEYVYEDDSRNKNNIIEIKRGYI